MKHIQFNVIIIKSIFQSSSLFTIIILSIMVKFHWIYLHKLTWLFSSNIRLLSNFLPFQLPDNFPTFQLPGYLVEPIHLAIWISGCLAIWLSGWTILSGNLAGPTCCISYNSTCCNTILHLLLILFPLVAPYFSTCCTTFFHLLIPLNPLVASISFLYSIHIYPLTIATYILSLYQSHSILKLYQHWHKYFLFF